MSQKEREVSLNKFRSAHSKILVSTDVASRGLDIPNVDVVINHNVPEQPKTYVHRLEFLNHLYKVITSFLGSAVPLALIGKN